MQKVSSCKASEKKAGLTGNPAFSNATTLIR